MSSSSEAWPSIWGPIFYILREDKNDALFRKMVLNNDVIDWTRNKEKSLFIYGVTETQKSVFDEVAQMYGRVPLGEVLEGKTFSIQKDDINEALIEVPTMKQLTCSTLRLDEAVLVQRRWQHILADDPDITAGIEFCIKNFPNICLRNDKREVIGHMLTACNGEMLMLNVTESHRRQGLGTAVQLLLCKKIYEQNERPFWIVLANNEQSLQMNAKMGAQLLDNGMILYGSRYKYIG
ncbi:unnamed protein product [Owenia fusiformis]|uniref:Glycine N-acyltransferase-like protein n=1 Tax=Owenia fusiformis TaxID=6347 RepID=A0A8S4NK38_OWEFU|nr:unnamed protein product [Owenia fusiformis]